MESPFPEVFGGRKARLGWTGISVTLHLSMAVSMHLAHP